MTNFSKRYRVGEDRPLDPATLHILSIVSRVAAEHDVSYLLVGATARDLLLFHVFGIHTGRATADVDIAFAVNTWDAFHELRTALLESGDFTAGNIPHRIYLVPQLSAGQKIPLDLIPFGGVAEADMIHWPPDRDTAMTVAGFEDAFRAAVHVELRSGVDATVASLAGLAVLKLFAWQERRHSDKDAVDLYRLMSTYADAGNLDRLYDEDLELLEQTGYDLELAGAALLGTDAHQLCSPPTLKKLQSFVRTPDAIDILSERIARSIWPMQVAQVPRIGLVVSKFAEQLAP